MDSADVTYKVVILSGDRVCVGKRNLPSHDKNLIGHCKSNETAAAILLGTGMIGLLTHISYQRHQI